MIDQLINKILEGGHDYSEWIIWFTLIISILRELIIKLSKKMDSKTIKELQVKIEKRVCTLEEDSTSKEADIKVIKKLIQEIYTEIKQTKFINEFIVDLENTANKEIQNASIENKEFLALLTNGKNKSSEFFRRLLYKGIKQSTLEELSADILIIFKELRNNITTGNLNISLNKYNVSNDFEAGTEFTIELKNDIIKPIIENASEELSKFTKGFYNGETDKKFKIFATSLIEEILKKSITLYKNRIK